MPAASALDAVLVANDQPDGALRLLVLLVQIGFVAAALLLTTWITRLLWREHLLRTVARQFPQEARDILAAGRRVPLMRRIPAPKDPYARTHRVVVAPLGDGRPGEAFWGPGPAEGEAMIGRDGSRTDALVRLTDGVNLLVVCLGRVGSTFEGHTVLPAAQRVVKARSHYTPPHQQALGPVDTLETAAGTGWRTTCTWSTGRALTDTHVDHDGWAFIIGVLSTSWHARAVDVYDSILSTWRWLPHTDDPWPAPEADARPL